MIRGVHTMFYSSGPIEDHGHGLVTRSQLPGGFDVQLCEPRYTKGSSK